MNRYEREMGIVRERGERARDRYEQEYLLLDRDPITHWRDGDANECPVGHVVEKWFIENYIHCGRREIRLHLKEPVRLP